MAKYNIHTEEIVQKIQHEICCIEITSVAIDILPGCILCKKPLVIVPGSKIVTCLHCRQTMKTTKCGVTFSCIVTIDGLEDKLNIPLDIINNFLKINVIEECQVDMDAVKEKILFVENANVIYNNKHVVTSKKTYNWIFKVFLSAQLHHR